jgi:predicted nucleic acid-binding protein
MTAAEFIDTNILSYAHAAGDDPRIAEAKVLMDRLWEAGGGMLSTQVLAEFFRACVRKQRVSPTAAREMVRVYTPWTAHSATPEDVRTAIDLSIEHTVSFWDALIVVSALALGARVLWSEDLQHGRRFGALEVRNPFALTP